MNAQNSNDTDRAIILSAPESAGDPGAKKRGQRGSGLAADRAFGSEPDVRRDLESSAQDGGRQDSDLDEDLVESDDNHVKANRGRSVLSLAAKAVKIAAELQERVRRDAAQTAKDHGRTRAILLAAMGAGIEGLLRTSPQITDADRAFMDKCGWKL